MSTVENPPLPPNTTRDSFCMDIDPHCLKDPISPDVAALLADPDPTPTPTPPSLFGRVKAFFQKPTGQGIGFGIAILLIVTLMLILL